MISIGWALIIGLGIFLYGMASLEAGIAKLSGARMKRWLSKSTASPMASAGFGAMVTTILQSSSMVSLLVLAFASAGIMPLYNAIGIILGANLGTTITGWLVATLGFKLELAKLAMPLLALGGFIQIVSTARPHLFAWGKTAVGLGLLLLGLSLMKDSVGNLPQQWDIALLQGYHPFVYLLFGLLLTAVIQSSSAAVMLTLTALHGGLIDLPEAGALVIGADLGTTSTTLLASLAGAGIKRQLALAQLVFNVVVDVLAFLLLLPILPVALQWLGLSDPLYSLVAFHSSFNLIGLLFFLPLLKPFAHWVGGFFQIPKDHLLQLADIDHPIPEAALPAMSEALQKLWLIAAANTLKLFSVPIEQLSISHSHRQRLLAAIESHNQNNSYRQTYEQIKQQEAVLFLLATRLQQLSLNEQQACQLGNMQELVRNIVYASKTMQDVTGDVQQLQNAVASSDVEAEWQLSQQQRFLNELYSQLLPLIFSKHEDAYSQEQLNSLEAENAVHYSQMDKAVYLHPSHKDAGELSLSIQLNLNREIHHACINLLHSVELWQKLI